jgi:sec-independent protein translocase protein TatA
MGDLLQPWHLVVLGVVAFLLFGAKRLPELGKGLGEGLKGFREGIRGVSDPPAAAPSSTSTPAESASKKEDMEYVTCSRCGNRFENPLGFKVADYVCRACQKSS